MSVTLKQALVLPSLRQATLLAGFDNLDRPITSVNVLEYIGTETLHQQSEPADRFAGGELVLTCFSSIPTNVDAQCECLRALSQVGQAGLVLYYVGSVMPQVDPALVTLAQELDFPLLVMPHRTELRYSEVIGDVMEAILRDQADNTHLLGDILEHMTLLPEHQRTVDTVLQLLSDRLRATVLLLDGTGQLLGACAWPRGSQADMTDLLIQARQGNADQCCRLTIDPGDAAPMELCLLKAGQPLSNEVQQQAQDVMQLALNLWSLKHAELAIEELVRAILRDEPIKMRRLAALFRLNVASIHCMWMLSPLDPACREEFLRRVPTIASQLLEPHCQAAIAGSYQDFVIVLADNGVFGPEGEALAAQLDEQLKAEGLGAGFVCCQGLENTAQVRAAFLRSSEGLPSAQTIWPTRTVHTLGEIDFALHCKNDLVQDEASVTRCRAVLAPLHSSSEELPLVDTLAVYLLDADQNIVRCAQQLFLHKNTVKYRYQQITHRLGHTPDKLPELTALYEAVALYRLLEK